MTVRDKPATDSRIPLVSGAVIAVRSRPYLAYLLALLALGLGSYVWWLSREDATVLRSDHDKLVQLEARVGELRRQQQRLVDDLALKGRQVDALVSRLGRLDETLNAEQRRAWLLNEADHYLHLAQQHLQLTRDIAGARTLLDVADRLLAAHGDNRLLPLRQAIARDRLALSAAAAVDVPGLYLRLNAVGERVATLRIPAESGGRPAAGAVVPAPLPGESALENGWSRLRGLVTVRRHEAPLQPLMSAADRALVRESIRLDISQAQLGLLRGEPVIFRQSLASARARLGRHFALLPKAELALLEKELETLAAVDIRPALPDLAASIAALDALVAHEPGPAFAPAERAR
jgi:uroporphyrin-3 C-methyltransferase